MRLKRLTELAVLAVLLIVAGYLALALGLPGDEDAFIYFRFALHWAHGQGLAFNPGNPVEGYSSPLWTALLAIAARLGVLLHIFARLLSLVCGLATIAATAWLTGQLGGRRWTRLGAAASLALNVWFLVWSQSGLETAAYALALTLAAGATVRLLDGRPPLGTGAEWSAGALLGITALSRPEGALMPLAVLAIGWYRRFPRTRMLRVAVPALAPLMLYVVWRRITFDAWLPNTSVKLYPLHFDRSLPQTIGFILFTGVITLGLPALAWAAARRRGQTTDGPAFVWATGLVLSLGFHLLVGGDYRPGYRYLVPALPLLIAAAWWALQELARAWPRRVRGAAAVGLVVCLLASSAREWLTNPYTSWRPAEAMARWRDPYADPSDWGAVAARWLLENVPRGSLVAYGQMGRAPYLLTLRGHDARFLDTVGWVDREVADIYRFDRKLRDLITGVLAGHGPREVLRGDREARARRFVDLLMARRPDYILIEAALQHAGVNEFLPRDPRFLRDYEKVADIGPGQLIAIFRRVARLPAPQ